MKDFDLLKHLEERFQGLDHTLNRAREEIRFSRQDRHEFRLFRDKVDTTHAEHQTRMSRAEDEVDSLRSRIDEAEGEIKLCRSRLDFLESDRRERSDPEWTDERDTIPAVRKGSTEEDG